MKNRALEVHTQWVTSLGGVFDQRAFNGRTVALLRVAEPVTGRCLDILGGGKAEQLPSSSSRIQYMPNERVARADDLHAEQVVLGSPFGLPPADRLAIATSRPFCDARAAGLGQQCMMTLMYNGAQIVNDSYAVW